MTIYEIPQSGHEAGFGRSVRDGSNQAIADESGLVLKG